MSRRTIGTRNSQALSNDFRVQAAHDWTALAEHRLFLGTHIGQFVAVRGDEVLAIAPTRREAFHPAHPAPSACPGAWRQGPGEAAGGGRRGADRRGAFDGVIHEYRHAA